MVPCIKLEDLDLYASTPFLLFHICITIPLETHTHFSQDSFAYNICALKQSLPTRYIFC